MAGSPIRGAGVRELGLALPPEPMAAWRGGRPLKRWRYVGVYMPELMLCVGDARIGPVPQRWWAVALPGGELAERTTFGAGGVALDAPWTGRAAPAERAARILPRERRAEDPGAARTREDPRTRPTASRVRVAAKGVRVELTLEESPGVEVVSPVNDRGAYIWTSKQACVPVSGFAEVDGTRYAIEADAGFVDDSAGYHARHTAWRWSAGVGRATDGRRVGWNLVAGVHDDPRASERTVWVDGEPRAVGPVAFADDLSEIAAAPDSGTDTLRFAEWSAREHATNALLLRSRYRQPFGTFSGTLPGGIELAAGYGVMEDHDVRW